MANILKFSRDGGPLATSIGSIFCETHHEEMSHDSPVPPTTGPEGKSPMMDVATKAEGVLG